MKSWNWRQTCNDEKNLNNKKIETNDHGHDWSAENAKNETDDEIKLWTCRQCWTYW